MPSSTLKIKLIAAIERELEHKISVISTQIQNTALAQQNDTKSSAGDKFETGREMLQAELNKYENQRLHLHQSLSTVRSIDADKKSKQVEFGSLIKTDSALYFIAIGLGKIELEGQDIVVISLASPLGKVLYHKQLRDTFCFNKRNNTIEAIY